MTPPEAGPVSFARPLRADLTPLPGPTMKKLRLELDDLAVESFSTSRDPRGGQGTVLGHFRAVIETQYLWQCAEVSWDRRCLTGGLDCYTADGAFSCEVVYTCPECASPPETYDVCGTMDLCA